MTRWILPATIVVGALAFAASLTGTAAEIVEFRVLARFLSAPAFVRMTVAVEPHEANRTLRVEMDGEYLFRSSDVTLAGATEKRFHEIQFRAVPAGHYRLQAAVLSAHDVRGTATGTLDVLE